MEQNEFMLAALGYLAKLYPEMDKRLATEEQIDLWIHAFGHLEHVVWKKAVDAYACEKHYPPTINGLMEFVPEQHRTKTGKPKDASSYDRPGAYRVFENGEELARNDFKPDLTDLYRKLNAREWGMENAEEKDHE